MHACKKKTYYYSEPHLLLCVGRSPGQMCRVLVSAFVNCTLRHTSSWIPGAWHDPNPHISDVPHVAWLNFGQFTFAWNIRSKFHSSHCSDQVLMKENLLDGYRNRSLSIGGLWICIGALYALSNAQKYKENTRSHTCPFPLHSINYSLLFLCTCKHSSGLPFRRGPVIQLAQGITHHLQVAMFFPQKKVPSPHAPASVTNESKKTILLQGYQGLCH